MRLLNVVTRRHGVLAAALLGLASLSCPQALLARGMLVNGDFETGGFDGWNVTYAAQNSFLMVDNGSILPPESGNYYALFGAQLLPGNADTISQTLSVKPGATYDVNFWVNDQHGGSDLVVTWGGTQLLHLDPTYTSGPANSGWADFDYHVSASGSSVTLSFAGASSGFFGLDNVTVPEVGSISTDLGALLGVVSYVACVRRRRANRA